MSFLNSKPDGGMLSNTMRKNISKVFPRCPLCGSREPAWTFRYRIDFADGRVQFRCSTCDSAFSITQTDLLGVPKLGESKNLLVHIYTWPVTVAESIKKKLKGKEVSTVYIRIDELGFVEDPPVQKGQEIPLEKLQQIANSIS